MSTSTPTANSTRALLTAGMIAGPLFVIVSLLQAVTVEGFDMKHHAFSLLTAGDMGWIQLINFLVTGILLTCGAVGVRRALRDGKGSKWGPILLGVFGVGTLLAGIFSADPAQGFPPGTPVDANDVSWHGMLHFTFASLGVLGLIIACFVLARRFRGAWAIKSRILGVLLIAAIMGISSGSGSDNTFVTPAFIITASLGYLWVSALSAKLKGELKA